MILEFGADFWALKTAVTSCRLCMESPFKDRTIHLLRRQYGHSCSVCLIRQTVTGSQCAHLYARAGKGEDQVDEARSLGLLDPTPGNEYHRSGSDNGTIQCPTCHLGYFTPGFMAFSPSLVILDWILTKLKRLKRANAQAVWKIFCSLEAKQGPEFNRFYHLYSLIPRFKPSRVPTAVWYDIYCDLPPIQIIGENGTFTPVKPGRIPRNRPHFRIFDVQETLQRRRNSRGMDVRPDLIRLFPGGIVDGGPVNYWRLPVPCHIMLYLFIDAIRVYGFDHTVPEVELAMKIYERLEEIRWNSDKTTFKAVRKEDVDHSRHDAAPVGTPQRHRHCHHPRRGNTLTYCATCWTLSPTNFSPLDTLQIDALDSEEEMTPSHPICTRTKHTPRITQISSYATTAYPTPSSLPKREHDGEDYFSSAPNCAKKLLTGRSLPTRASSADSPESSKSSAVGKHSCASNSNQEPDYQRSGDSRSSDELETDGDTSTDGVSQDVVRR